MGKRAGNIVTIDEVMDEIDEAAGRKGAGADALRFFFLSRSANSNVEFDIELAKKKSLDNPVFYVQYGYARLCSILRNGAEAIGLDAAAFPLPGEWASSCTPTSSRSRASSADFPDVVRRGRAAARAAPDRLLRPGARARLPELLHAPQGRARSHPSAGERARRGRVGGELGLRARRARASRGSRRSACAYAQALGARRRRARPSAWTPAPNEEGGGRGRGGRRPVKLGRVGRP